MVSSGSEIRAGKVAIVGAGMGGLALAIALRKVGIACTVFEQASRFSPVGICLSVFPNGRRVLAALSQDLSDGIGRRGHVLSTMCIRKPSGEVVAEKPHDFEARFGFPLTAIRWSSLHALLRAELPEDVVKLAHRVVGARDAEDGMVLDFADGHRETFSLVVAADGIHSKLRAKINDDAPHHVGRLSCRAVIAKPRDLDVAFEGVMIDQATGQTFATGPVGEGHIFWNAMVQSDAGPIELEGEAAKAFVLNRYEAFADVAKQLVLGTPASEILVRPILTRTPLSRMHQGRLVVLGDAAHAMQLSTGQGANLSFEDAFELAQCLSTCASWDDALQTFSDSRVPRAQTVHARNAVVSQKAHSAEAHQFMKGVVERAQLGEADFQEYLHRYTPPLGWTL